jgi:hypothetical protein
MSSVALESTSRIVKPRMRAPQLSVPTVGGGRWSLEESAAERFTVIFCYRGLCCPICRKQLGEPDRQLGEFERRGRRAVGCQMPIQATNSAPFPRPAIDGLLEAIDFVTENGYPARGEV